MALTLVSRNSTPAKLTCLRPEVIPLPRNVPPSKKTVPPGTMVGAKA